MLVEMDPDDVSMEPVSAGGATDVTYISLNKPVWVYGLRNATWLLPVHDPRAKLIAFTPLSCPTANAGPQPEDDRGRFSRAVTLFLSESFWFRCGLRPVAMIAAVKGAGPAMIDHEMSQTEVADLGVTGFGYVVTGTLTEDGLTCEIALTLWDAPQQKELQKFVRQGPRFRLGAMVLELDEELRAVFGDQGAPANDWYEAPGPLLIDGYLGALARSLTLFMAEKGVVPRDQLVGEPNLLQWMSDYAAAVVDLPIPSILFTAGIATDRAMGSDIYAGFKDAALALVSRCVDQTHPFYRVAPLLLQIYGDEAAYADRCATLLENGEAPLLDWLSALEEQPK
jgi:hypothetical protein